MFMLMGGSFLLIKKGFHLSEKMESFGATFARVICRVPV